MDAISTGIFICLAIVQPAYSQGFYWNSKAQYWQDAVVECVRNGGTFADIHTVSRINIPQVNMWVADYVYSTSNIAINDQPVSLCEYVEVTKPNASSPLQISPIKYGSCQVTRAYVCRDDCRLEACPDYTGSFFAVPYACDFLPIVYLYYAISTKVNAALGHVFSYWVSKHQSHFYHSSASTAVRYLNVRRFCGVFRPGLPVSYQNCMDNLHSICYFSSEDGPIHHNFQRVDVPTSASRLTPTAPSTVVLSTDKNITNFTGEQRSVIKTGNGTDLGVAIGVPLAAVVVIAACVILLIVYWKRRAANKATETEEEPVYETIELPHGCQGPPRHHGCSNPGYSPSPGFDKQHTAGNSFPRSSVESVYENDRRTSVYENTRRNCTTGVSGSYDTTFAAPSLAGSGNIYNKTSESDFGTDESSVCEYATPPDTFDYSNDAHEHAASPSLAADEYENMPESTAAGHRILQGIGQACSGQNIYDNCASPEEEESKYYNTYNVTSGDDETDSYDHTFSSTPPSRSNDAAYSAVHYTNDPEGNHVGVPSVRIASFSEDIESSI